jgi:Tol biopolymer transport system component
MTRFGRSSLVVIGLLMSACGAEGPTIADGRSEAPPSSTAPSATIPLPPPDGRWIAFAADARAGAGLELELGRMDVEFGPGPMDIYFVREGVRPHRPFDALPEGGERSCPAFSPDGSRFVYRETRPDAGASFVVMTLDATGTPDGVELQIALPSLEGAPSSCAAWSPDGRLLAYVAPDQIGQMDLHVADLEGGDVIFDPVPNTTTTGGFAWSPVGQTLAYVDVGLWLVSVAGQAPHRLVPAVNEEIIEWVTWSPDGSVLDVGLALLEIEPDPGGNGFSGVQTGSEIRRIDVDGATEQVPDAVSGLARPTVWSPGGTAIAYEGPDGIILTDQHGNQLDVLRSPGGPDRGAPRPLAWSSDGRSLLAIVPAADGLQVLALLSTNPPATTLLTPETRALSYIDRDLVSWQSR